MIHPTEIGADRPGSIPRSSSGAGPLWFVAVISFLWISFTMSPCGHTSWPCSLVMFPAFFYACYVFFGFPRGNRLDRILVGVAFVLIVGMLLKNIGDILYFGHQPLLR
jgi:hypothetical protein